MKHSFFLVTALIWIFVAVNASAQSIVINEFMASNATTIADEDGDYEDWIELHNYGNEAINLEGWSLSDDYDLPGKWIFPDIAIDPGAFLIVWASGKDRKEAELHTNFSISSQGEELILVNSYGNRIDEITPVFVPTDISYGRFPDGTGLFYYFPAPTPGMANANDGLEDLLSPPVFSHGSGFYTESFYLKVHHSDPEAIIRYTLDGSLPDAGSEIFPDSLLIYNRKNDPDQISAVPTTPPGHPESFMWFAPMDTVFKGTVVRIKAFRSGAISPFTPTYSYWVDEEIFNRYSLPVISIAMDQEDLFGTEGLFVNPTMTGPEWEREMHIEFFEPNGIQGFNTHAGVRLHGGISRQFALKSLRIYFRNRYGDSHVEYPVFPDQQMNRHERLILRNAGSDWHHTYFRDAFVQSILRGFTDVEYQAYRPAVVFLNSEYWGILNIRERFDNNYIKNHYGHTEIDLLENTGSVKYGTNTHYLNLIAFLQGNSLEDPDNYDYVKTQMEVDDFRDYHILQVFSMNTDQPGKNADFWRPQTPEGRWRWMWYDFDDSFRYGYYNHYDRNGLIYCTGLNSISATTVNPVTPPPDWAPNGPVQTFPLRALLGSPAFRESFITRFADLLNTAFQPFYINDIVDTFDARVGPYLYEHYRRWHRPTPALYSEHVQHLRDFAALRATYMRNHMVDFFELDGSYNLNLNVASGNGILRVNSIEVKQGGLAIPDPAFPWDGVYFNGLPIEIEALPLPGYRFSHWEGSVNTEDNVIGLNPDTDIALTAHFVPHYQPELISFWYFNTDLPNDTPLEQISPWFSLNPNSSLYYHSCLDGYPFSSGHPLWRKASMERRNSPTPINYFPEGNNNIPFHASDMRGIQIRQPLADNGKTNQLYFNLPTSGFRDIVFSFAAKDEGAAENITLEYALDHSHENWIQIQLSDFESKLENYYKLFSADFSGIPEVENNEEFTLRISFEGENLEEDQGNRVVFNNFSLHGVLLETLVQETDYTNQRLTFYPNPAENGIIYLTDFMDVMLYDTNGRLVRNFVHTRQVSLEGLSPGIYILRNTAGQSGKVVVPLQ